MKLWEKSVSVDKAIEKFTIGNDREMDLYLASWDVLGSIAHITMLNKIQLISDNELPVLLRELKVLYEKAQDGKLIIEEGVEDIHSQVEILTKNWERWERRFTAGVRVTIRYCLT